MQLSSRKHEILCAAIEDYIKDASPITSSGVQMKHAIKLSTATLRNELNTLEEMGFLKQIYTSGGRIPTAEGYRYYANELMRNVKVDNKTLEKVKLALEQRTRSLSEIASEIAKIISHATNYPTAVLVSGYDKLIVEGVSVIPLIDGKQALALVQTKSGYISNAIEAKASKKECDDASIYLSKLFAGKTIGFLIENIEMLKEGIKKHISGFEKIIGLVIENLKTISQRKLLDISHESFKEIAEKGKAEDMQKILALLSDEEKLSSSLERTDGEIFIEVDDQDEQMAGLALVKVPLIMEGNQVASIGVLGPQRMDYASITAALKLVVDELKGGEKGND